MLNCHIGGVFAGGFGYADVLKLKVGEECKLLVTNKEWAEV